MKPLLKIFTISIFLILSFFIKPQDALAQTLDQTSLSATFEGSVINARLQIGPATGDGIKIVVKETPFDNNLSCNGVVAVVECQQPANKSISGGFITWIIPKAGGKTYYIRAEGPPGTGVLQNISNVIIIKTGPDTIDAKWPLTSQTDGNTVWIMGKINNPNISDFTTIKLQYSATPFTDLTESLPASAYEVSAQKSNISPPNYGINTDGTYGFRIVGLTPGQAYSFKQIIKTTSGAVEIKRGAFTSNKGIVAENSASQAKSDAQRSYKLLSDRSGLSIVLDNDLCREYVAAGKPVPGGSCDNQISYYINLLIKIMIGLSAVFLVIQLIIQGYQYMVTDIPFLKASAKSKFFNSLFGLLLAMSSYLILNTINPRLISSDINIQGIDLGIINDFEVSGSFTGSFDTKPIKVNFNKDAYPAAKAAFEKTGVPIAFTLAIFAQETGSGKNLGACKWDGAGVMREDSTRKDKTAFTTIMSELGIDRGSKSVSCPFGGGWGGAIGYTQFIPSTWLEQRVQAGVYLGHTPNPWKLEDSIMTSAVYLKRLGAVSDPRNAACKYYSGRVCDDKKPYNSFYGDQVMGKKLSIEKQIADSIKKGDIK
jgi:stringent starvation protein B